MVKYTDNLDDDDFDIFANIGDERVGWAFGSRDGDRVKLVQIYVQDGNEPLLQGMSRPSDLPPPTNYRGQRIGDELLRRFLAAADEAGIVEVWGEITAKDAEETTYLLGMYQRRGFVAVEPDEECETKPLKKIVRRSGG